MPRNTSNLDRKRLRLEEHTYFICPECGKQYNTQSEWRIHLNVQHNYATKTAKDFNFKEINSNFHECQICMKWVANAHQVLSLLQCHSFVHLPHPRTYRCKYCVASFMRKKSLCQHLHKCHDDILSNVDDQNSKNNEFYIKYLCPLCGQMFDRFNIWQQHIDVAHSSTSVDLSVFRIRNTKNYYCAQCCQTLYNEPSKTGLQRHNFTHQTYPLYFQCSYCSTKTNYKTELLLHVAKSHREKFEKYKEYIKIPIEWGGQADKDIIRELHTCFEENRTTQTDILQKAIQDSLIDFEEEVDKEMKFKHEIALNQSFQEMDDIIYAEMNPDIQLAMNDNRPENDYDDETFEYLCNEIFEEIDEECLSSQEEVLKPNRKRLKLELSVPQNGLKLNYSLQKEMQKYINYLCPECGRQFETQSVWRTHVFEQHNLANAVETKFHAFNSQKTAFTCLVCHQVQHTEKHSELRRHHFQHMPYQAYLKCAICTKTKSSKPKMLQHLQYSHLEDIQKNINATTTIKPTMRCIDCDKSYVQPARFENHCRQCPQRLQPLAVGQYDIEKNMKLLEHLRNASIRIEKLLEEEGISVSSIKLPYK